MPDRKKPLATVLAALILAAVPAAAQDIEKEGQRPKGAETTQQQAVQTSEEAAKLSAEGPDVTYEQILENPDDIDLNYRYARTQVRKGDLKGASATLERILLVNPNLPKIRLFYAVVLFRLDNLDEAERELKTLKDLPMPESLRDEIKEYLKLIEKRRTRTRLNGSLSLGFEYDTNRNAAPSGGERLFGNTPLALADSQQRQQDTNFIGIANVGVHHDLGTQAGHELFGSLTYFRADQTVVTTLNLQAYSLQLGGVYKSRYANLTPTAYYDYVTLNQQRFLVNHGAGIRADKQVDRRTSLFAEFKDVYQDYYATNQVGSAPERKGIQLEVNAGGDYLLNPTMKLGLALTHTVKHAFKNYNAFERNGLAASHSWLLGKGTFLLSSVNFNYDQYDAPDTAISRDLRRDETWRLGATYGAPLTLLHPKLKNLLGALTYEYYHATSSVRNYSYDNTKIVALLTYKWEAGISIIPK